MSILSDLTPAEIGISGLIITFIAVFTALGFIKGVVKLVFLLFTIAGSGYAAYWGSYEGLNFLQRSWPGAPGQLAPVFAFICGIVVFYLLSKIFGFFTNPFENNGFIAGFAFGVPAAIISLVAVVCLVWLSLNFLNNKGAEGELKYLITQDDENVDARMKSYPTLANFKQKVELVGIGRSLANIYKLHDAEKFTLAKLLIIANTDKERMKQLSERKQVIAVLQHSLIRDIMKDLATRKQIVNNDVQGIIVNSLINQAVKDKKIREDLSQIAPDLLR